MGNSKKRKRELERKQKRAAETDAKRNKEEMAKVENPTAEDSSDSEDNLFKRPRPGKSKYQKPLDSSEDEVVEGEGKGKKEKMANLEEPTTVVTESVTIQKKKRERTKRKQNPDSIYPEDEVVEGEGKGKKEKMANLEEPTTVVTESVTIQKKKCERTKRKQNPDSIYPEDEIVEGEGKGKKEKMANLEEPTTVVTESVTIQKKKRERKKKKQNPDFIYPEYEKKSQRSQEQNVPTNNQPYVQYEYTPNKWVNVSLKDTCVLKTCKLQLKGLSINIQDVPEDTPVEGSRQLQIATLDGSQVEEAGQAELVESQELVEPLDKRDDQSGEPAQHETGEEEAGQAELVESQEVVEPLDKRDDQSGEPAQHETGEEEAGKAELVESQEVVEPLDKRDDQSGEPAQHETGEEEAGKAEHVESQDVYNTEPDRSSSPIIPVQSAKPLKKMLNQMDDEVIENSCDDEVEQLLTNPIHNKLEYMTPQQVVSDTLLEGVSVRSKSQRRNKGSVPHEYLNEEESEGECWVGESRDAKAAYLAIRNKNFSAYSDSDEDADDEFEAEDEHRRNTLREDSPLPDMVSPSDRRRGKGKKQRKIAPGSLRDDGRVYIKCPACLDDLERSDCRNPNKEVKEFVADKTTIVRHIETHKRGRHGLTVNECNDYIGRATKMMNEAQAEATKARKEIASIQLANAKRKSDKRDSQERARICCLCHNKFSHTTLYGSHFKEGQKNSCTEAKKRGILTSDKETIRRLVGQCLLAVDVERDTLQFKIAEPPKADYKPLIEEQCKLMNLKWKIDVDDVAGWVQLYLASPYGNNRVCEDLVDKMRTKGHKATPEERRLLAKPRYTVNRIKNVLNYFFPTGSFHLARLADIAHEFGDSVKLKRYYSKSRVDGKTVDKAPGTVANEVRAIMIVCSVIMTYYHCCQSVCDMLRWVCECMNKLGNNLAKEQLNKKNTAKILSEQRDLIPNKAIVEYLTHPTVVIPMSELLNEKFVENYMEGTKYSNEEIHNYSKHLAMWMSIRYGKRPVVVSGLRMKDVRMAIERRRKEMEKEGDNFDKTKNVYFTVSGEYATTKFKTVTTPTFSIHPKRWKCIENLYFLRGTQRAVDTDTLFVSKTGCNITNVGRQIVQPAWHDDAKRKETFTGPIMRHTICTWSADCLDTIGQNIVAKNLEHSLNMAQKTYQENHREHAEQYQRLTNAMLQEMPEGIDVDDVIDAQTEYDVARIEEADEHHGMLVFRNMSKMIAKDNNTNLTVYDTDDEDPAERRNFAERDNFADPQPSCSGYKPPKSKKGTSGNTSTRTRQSNDKPSVHSWTEAQKLNFNRVFKAATAESIKLGMVIPKDTICNISHAEMENQIKNQKETKQALMNPEHPFHFLVFGDRKAEGQIYKKLSNRIYTAVKKNPHYHRNKDAYQKKLAENAVGKKRHKRIKKKKEEAETEEAEVDMDEEEEEESDILRDREISRQIEGFSASDESESE